MAFLALCENYAVAECEGEEKTFEKLDKIWAAAEQSGKTREIIRAGSGENRKTTPLHVLAQYSNLTVMQWYLQKVKRLE